MKDERWRKEGRKGWREGREGGRKEERKEGKGGGRKEGRKEGRKTETNRPRWSEVDPKDTPMPNPMERKEGRK